jgi:hypothetical protein
LGKAERHTLKLYFFPSSLLPFALPEGQITDLNTFLKLFAAC